MAQRDLKRVGKARERHDNAERELHAAILAAADSGETYRDIGKYARLSHQRIYEIVKEMRARRDDAAE